MPEWFIFTCLKQSVTLSIFSMTTSHQILKFDAYFWSIIMAHASSDVNRDS